MHRTQLYIEDHAYESLRRRAREEGRSISEIVREAIRWVLGELPAAERARLLQEAAGAWSDRTDLPATAHFVRGLRQGRRLSRTRGPA